MKCTPLFKTHQKYGAKFTEFNGWNMPLWFSSLENEHLQVRADSGVFDVSHMGEIIIEGNDALSFLDFTFTNKISSLKNGQAKYGFFCDSNANVIDDVIAYKLDENKYFLCVNAGNIDIVFDWLVTKSKSYDVDIKNLSDFYGQLAIQGPNSMEYLSKIFPLTFSEEFKKYTIINIMDLDEKYQSKSLFDSLIEDNFLIARTGYTGEDGFELFVPNELINEIYKNILEDCPNIKPCGLGSRDTLRIEKGFPLHGNEFTKGTSPSDFNLDKFIDSSKHNFIGKDAILKKISENEFSFVGFLMEDNSIARNGYEIFNNGSNIGKVTSGTYSPILKKGIGLALINSDFSELRNFDIKIRKNFRRAVRVDYPFV